MTKSIEISDSFGAVLVSNAKAKGLSIEDYIKKLMELDARRPVDEIRRDRAESQSHQGLVVDDGPNS